MIPFFHLLAYPCGRLHSHGTPPSAQLNWGGVHSRFTEGAGQPEPRMLEIDVLALTDPNALPEHLVDAVRRLKFFLPADCEMLGQDDLKIVESFPIDAGGFAEVWLGERNDGTAIAIKSHRCHSSSSRLPVYMVSDQHYLANVTCSLKVTGRGCTRKR